MISKDNQISLTYVLGGESLVKAGVYKSAVIKVKNAWQKDEEVTLVKPMETISSAQYSKALQRTVLSTAFTEECLTRPKKPQGTDIHRWLRTPQGMLYQNWKKLTPEQRVETCINIYVDDLGGELLEWAIL